jgi:hypothetical protein
MASRRGAAFSKVKSFSLFDRHPIKIRESIPRGGRQE